MMHWARQIEPGNSNDQRHGREGGEQPIKERTRPGVYVHGAQKRAHGHSPAD